MNRQPADIPDHIWGAWTSPENYFMDNEISASQAAQVLRQRIAEYRKNN